MFKKPCKKRALIDSLPIQSSFMNQKMEESVIGSGNCAPKAGLARTSLLSISKMSCLLQQIVGKWHWRLSPLRFVQLGLLGQTSVIEIRVYPQLVGLDFIPKSRSDNLRKIAQFRPACSFI